MRVENIIYQDELREELYLIKDQCSEFLSEAGNLPLLKNLPRDYGDFHKVKIRKRKLRKQDSIEISEVFHEAFEKETQHIREKAVFAYGEQSFDPADDGLDEPYYIFPVDGYRYLYSKEVSNSNKTYQEAFDSIFERLGADKGTEIITELLRFIYVGDNLQEGIEQGSEIIIYNIPYFYAIKVSTVDDFGKLMETIKEID